MVKTAAATDKPLQVRIFPKRLLQPENAEKILNEIDQTEGVIGTEREK